MALRKQLKEVNKELELYETFKPTNWFYKWVLRILINRVNKRRKSILTQIEINKFNYGNKGK
jgi:hypothetical protein